MANTDFIQQSQLSGLSVISTKAFSLAEHENKSCSMASLTEQDLLKLRGKLIQVVQQFKHSLPDSRFIARVMAVHLPAYNSGVETSLLLLQEGCSLDEADYVDVSALRLLRRL